ALGVKVSDEFTVPLCRSHHRQLHQAGNEIVWWKRTSMCSRLLGNFGNKPIPMKDRVKRQQQVSNPTKQMFNNEWRTSSRRRSGTVD
ncbi:MAG: hypothetical protein WCF29_03510, partial [Pseudolabrys sp.]